MPEISRVRPPAVAGTFYASEARALADDVDRLLEDARADVPPGAAVPKALIAPHAGYIYSSPVAASAYARVCAARGRIARVVLLGPTHRVAFRGLAEPGVDGLETPLGVVRTGRPDLAGVLTSAQAHAREHALEVHLPFIQRALGDVEVIPLLVGDADDTEVAATLDALWGGPDTLIVVSSDLSHYHDWRDATAIDHRSAHQIESLGPGLTHEQACGATPINGLLLEAQRRGMRVERLDLRNSGDTAGPRDRVVGYGAFAFYEPGTGR